MKKTSLNRTKNKKIAINFSKIISRGLDWVTNSGIISREKDTKRKGGVYAWYEPDNRTFSYLYSEVTGYMITFLIYFYKKTGNKTYLNLAKECAHWITKVSYYEPAQGVFCRYYPETRTFRRQICSFDNATVLNGLLNLHRFLGITDFQKVSEKLYQRIISNFKVKNGVCWHRYLPDENKMEEESSHWSHQRGSFLIKSAVSILNYSELLKDRNGIDLVKDACEKVIKMQKDDGKFITDKFNNHSYLHPHCYTLEGLTVAGILLDRKDFLKASTKGIRWILKEQLPSGGFPNQFYHKKFSSFESIDIDSQIMRLWTIHNSLNLTSLDEADYFKGIKNIIRFQNLSQEKSVNGGFRYGTDIEGKEFNHINSWGTIFALQALNIVKENLNKSFFFEPFLLV